MSNYLPIILEVVSPAEAVGKDWIISVGLANSPFGTCLIGDSPRGVCHLSFVESADGAAEMRALQSVWPHARLRRDDDSASRLVNRIFSQTSDEMPPLHAVVLGTPFQIQVWRALLKVPYGALISYGRLAATIDRPKAARAVGTAVGKNPISVLIPCHRVIRETGEIGNYHWGVERKRALIAWEQAASF